MPYKLSKKSLDTAIEHLARYGDTDVFPHLPEIHFFADQKAEIVDELSKLDLNSYQPAGAVEALTPKGRYGFRICHQLNAIDTLLFLASTIEIGNSIEKFRIQKNSIRAFSYRFSPQSDGNLFAKDRTYERWIKAQIRYIEDHEDVEYVVLTDIADFYARINFHRLENLLDESVGPNNGAARYIKHQLKVIRAKQSFGIPVGGSAARLLSELALCDTDRALQHEGLDSTRFVDDFRLFIPSNREPYDAISFLAEQLSVNEGLSLNASKTKVLERAQYIAYLEYAGADVGKEAESAAIKTITDHIYFDGDIDEESLQELASINLIKYLNNEIYSDDWDIGRIKILFRALRFAKPVGISGYIDDKFQDLIPFSRELCLLMQDVERDDFDCFWELGGLVIESILNSPASSVHIIRAWLLEIFVKNIITLEISDLTSLKSLSDILDRRQLLLIRGRLGDKNYFRKHKTKMDQFARFEFTAFLWAASCLPSDEYEVMLANAKPLLKFPGGGAYAGWLKSNKADLNGLL